MNLILSFLVYRPDVGYVKVRHLHPSLLKIIPSHSAFLHHSLNSSSFNLCVLESEFPSGHTPRLLQRVLGLHLLRELRPREAVHYTL